MRKKCKVAILAFDYSITFSPAVRSMASYFANNGIETVLLVDTLRADLEEEIKDIKVIYLTPERLIVLYHRFKKGFLSIPFIGKYIFILYRVVFDELKKYIVVKTLNKVNGEYDYIFSIEMNSLDLLYKSGFPLNKTIYFSLELEQHFKTYRRNYIKKLVSGCLFCIIQNKERAANLSSYLKSRIEYELFPVSIPPIKRQDRLPKTENVILVYSGFISGWSYLIELVNAVKKLPGNQNVNLIISGWTAGTDDYLKKLRLATYGAKNISIDTSYKKEKELISLLMHADIGVALYKKPNDDKNWDNLLTSSGKIAYYLWSGLAVLTNLKDKITDKPPFLYIDNVDEIRERFLLFQKNRDLYKKRAIILAKHKYNSNIYLKRIFDRLIEVEKL